MHGNYHGFVLWFSPSIIPVIPETISRPSPFFLLAKRQNWTTVLDVAVVNSEQVLCCRLSVVDQSELIHCRIAGDSVGSQVYGLVGFSSERFLALLIAHPSLFSRWATPKYLPQAVGLKSREHCPPYSWETCAGTGHSWTVRRKTFLCCCFETVLSDLGLGQHIKTVDPILSGWYWSQNRFGTDILTCSFFISNLVADLHSHSYSIDVI